MRLICWLLRKHSYECYDVGHGTGVSIYHCRRCPKWWVLS